jgi:hypothetical protein
LQFQSVTNARGCLLLPCIIVDETTFAKNGRAIVPPPSSKSSKSVNRASVRDHENAWNRINGAIVTDIKVTLKPPKGENFLSVIALSRAMNLVINAKDLKESKEELAAVFPLNTKVYTLVCAKASAESSGPRFCPKREILTLTYMAESGKGIPIMDMKEELEHWGDFAVLDVNKAVARMSLLQSTYASVHTLSASDDFEMIEEECNVGCGFIPDHMMDEYYPRTPKVALQVRIFSPRLGILKGVLMRKPGIDRIQLPPSMVKVSPSKNKESRKSDEAILLITKQGRHPTSFNTQLAKQLAGKDLSPSFDKSIKKLSDMICRMLIGLGVPVALMNEYVRRSQRREKLRHAWIVGVADPTGGIPEGHVFVTGFHDNHPGQVFITRSPCLEASDAKLLPLLLEKPSSMTQFQWDWMRKLPFGAVIFGNPIKESEPTLPETIADGDLDGDLYLICWSKNIVSRIEAANKDRIVNVLECYHDGGELRVVLENFLGVRKEYSTRKVLKRRGAITAAVRYVEEHSGRAVEHLKRLLPAPELPMYRKVAPQLERIISHRRFNKRVDVEVQWRGGNAIFEPIEMVLDGFPDAVIAYAKRHKQWRKDSVFKAVLAHLNKEKRNKSRALERGRKLSVMGDSPSLAQEENWFTKAQAHMLDLAKRDKITRFVCSLYKLCVQHSKDGDFGEQNIDDPDAMAFGRAFKLSLKIEKHDVRVPLPAQYKDRINADFHNMCSWK